jgi:hypothetical protein
MRRLLLVLIPLLIIAIIVGGLFLAARVKQYAITIYREEGSVMFKPEGGEYVEITEEEKNIPNHSFVKTSGDGLAEIVLPDNSMISLSNDTEMQINFDANINVVQSIGKAWFRVQKLAGKKEFTVESPTAIASVRGTIFGVEHTNAIDPDVIYVTDSEVEIAELVLENGQKVKKNIQTLGKNKLAKILAGENGKVEIVDLPQEKKDTAWFQRNEIINEEFKKGNPRGIIKKLKNDARIKDLTGKMKAAKNKTLGVESGNFLEGLTSPDFLSDSSKVCDSYKSSEYEAGLEKIRNSKELFGGWGSWLLSLAEDLKNACQDGQIDSTEAVEIEKLYGQQPSATFVPQIPSQ